MRPTYPIAVLLIAAACRLPAADQPATSDAAVHGDGHHRAALLAKYDTDHDGKLSPSERAAAKAAHQQHALGKWDTDHDGTLSASERAARRDAIKQRILAKYDTDHDGTLSPAERAAAKTAREEHRAKHRAHASDGA